MPEQPIMRKILLRQHRRQRYTAFCAQYEKVVRQIDGELVRAFPQPHATAQLRYGER